MFLLVVPMTFALPSGRHMTAYAYAPTAQDIAQARNGPYPDEIIWSEEMDEVVAIEKLKKGELQAYIWGLTDPAAIHMAQLAPEIRLASSYPGWNSLSYNPFPTYNITAGGSGELNPFKNMTFREAFNYLIDRDYIVREILHYLGVPLWTPWPPSFPDYMKVYSQMKEIEAEYPYDPYMAMDIIEECMTYMGAYKKAGIWYWKNPIDDIERPVTIRIFIRIEDYRRLIGEYVASLLEDLGFTVERIYGDSAKASAVVMSDMTPWKGKWHIYTSGWVMTTSYSHNDWVPIGFEWALYDPHFYFYFYPYYFYVLLGWSWEEARSVTTWFGGFPDLLPEEPDPFAVEFFQAMWRLYIKDYATEEERNELVVNCTRMCLKHSFNTWLVNSMDIFAWNKGFGNMAFDVLGGLYSIWAYRTMAFLDEAGNPTVGGTAHLGNKRMFIEPWNPIAGSTWLYDSVIFRCIHGYSIYFHPHTGVSIPVQTTFKVEGTWTPENPEATMPIPDTAFYPNWTGKAEDGYIRWVSAHDVGYNESRFVVTLNFHFGKWHYSNIGHDISMDLSDILYMLAFWARMGLSEGEDPIYEADPAYYPEARWFPRYFRGIEVINNTAVKVYFDFWHVEKSHIAEYADDCLWTVLPWEVMAAMVKAREDEKIAFSSGTAAVLGVPWLDIAKDPESIDALKDALDALSAENYIPPFLDATRDDVAAFGGDIWGVDADEATARWSALNAWYDATAGWSPSGLGHFYVSNGPFYLHSVDVAGKKVRLKAHPGYPFPPGHFNELVKAITISVEAKAAEAIPGLPTTVEAYVTKAGAPYSNVDAMLVIYDPEGNVLFEKDAEVDAATGRVYVELTEEDTSKLVVGICRMTFLVTDLETGLKAAGGAPLLVKPLVAYWEELLSDLEATLMAEIAGAKESAGEASEKVGALEATIGELRTLVIATMAVAAISMISAIAGIFFVKKGAVKG